MKGDGDEDGGWDGDGDGGGYGDGEDGGECDSKGECLTILKHFFIYEIHIIMAQTR